MPINAPMKSSMKPPMPLRRIGVLAHPTRPKSYPLAERITENLRQHGIETWLYTQWDEATVNDDVQLADMLIAIGGDGAMLKAARVGAPYGVPVLGVNMGRLGFLTEVAQPDEWETHLARVLKGDYWIETRMMVHVQIEQHTEHGVRVWQQGDALNDVVISGSGVGKMIQLNLHIDGNWTTTYNADALIIATPTGSTAYALAVGGPILPPDIHNILIVPSAPHLSMERPIVLSEGSQVAVRIAPANRHEIVAVVDGINLGAIPEGAEVRISACDYSSHFVRLRERNYFYRSLLDRLEPRISRQQDDTQ
jgi:NAD+ kinase